MATTATCTQDGTIRMTAATAFRLTLMPSKQFVQILVKTGTLWIKRYAAGVTPPTALPTVAVIPASAAFSDYVELTDGDVATFGNSDSFGIRRTLGAPGSVGTIDVWCEADADLVLVSQ